MDYSKLIAQLFEGNPRAAARLITIVENDIETFVEKFFCFLLRLSAHVHDMEGVVILVFGVEAVYGEATA